MPNAGSRLDSVASFVVGDYSCGLRSSWRVVGRVHATTTGIAFITVGAIIVAIVVVLVALAHLLDHQTILT